MRAPLSCARATFGVAIALLAFTLSAGAQGQNAPLVRGLDHVPIGVRDLEQAQADFARLGFAIKPGRAHANGIRNAHIKFRNGTEIELITASTAQDSLSARYVEFLRIGEGPVLLGLYAPDLPALPAQLSARNVPSAPGIGVPLSLTGRHDWIFFDRRQNSPTDRDAHFAHANGASELAAVWIAASPADRSLLRDLGGETVSEIRCSPFAAQAAVLRLGEGEIVLVPLDEKAGHPTQILALTVFVQNLRLARQVIGTRAFKPAAECAADSLWIDPTSAHGLWLELRERPVHRP